MNSPTNWSAHQLAEFLAVVSAFRDESSAINGAVERASEAVEAEVCAVLRNDCVVSIVGFPRGQTPVDELVAVSRGSSPTLFVPGVGDCPAISLVLEDDEPGALVLARSGEAFTVEELSLARGMARVLTMTLRILRALDGERRHAEETADLVESLQRRQRLLEQLAAIQQLISHRRPLAHTLAAIAAAAAELIGRCEVALRELGGAKPELVIAERYDPIELPIPELVGAELYATLAAPMNRDNKVIGSLVVALTDPDRTFTQLEIETAVTLAEHASLAFNDASAAEGMRQAFAEALHQANHDGLTGLPNRTLALDRLGQALVRCERLSAPVTVLFVDLDRFKRVNDSLGHSVGDDVLLCAAERLSQAVRASDTVARLAGDEFLVICEGLPPWDVMRVAQRIADCLAEPMKLGGRETIITASIGIAHGAPGADPEELVGNADVAMYRAKEAGRSGIELFDQVMRDQIVERIEIEHSLRRALSAEEFTLEYQPVVDAVDGRLVGLEALLRWHDGGYGAPTKFLPVAEDTGLIKQIGAWVLKEACTRLSDWRSMHPELLDVYVSVNLSAIEFSQPNVVELVGAVLAETGLPPQCLSLEITESVVMADAAVTTQTLMRLKQLGIHLAVDDFGTGYSSLAYLKRLPVDVLKIDRSFVSQLDIDTEDQAIAAAIISLGDTLGLEIVAEGVETPSQLRELRRLGCQAVQGFLVGRPQPAYRILEELARNGVLAS